VGLKLVFLIVTRAVSLLGLSGRESRWKDAEIPMLRHQLAVAQRERPRAHSRLTWPDRAWLALLAGTVPAERLASMRLIVAPCQRIPNIDPLGFRWFPRAVATLP
jgi:putative transposase